MPAQVGDQLIGDVGDVPAKLQQHADFSADRVEVQPDALPAEHRRLAEHDILPRRLQYSRQLFLQCLSGIGSRIAEQRLGGALAQRGDRLALGRKIRVAVHFDQRRRLPVRAGSALHAPFAGGALGQRRLHALLAKGVDRLFDVPFDFGQHLLALHHRLTGAGAEFVNELGGDLCHDNSR